MLVALGLNSGHAAIHFEVSAALIRCSGRVALNIRDGPNGERYSLPRHIHDLFDRRIESILPTVATTSLLACVLCHDGALPFQRSDQQSCPHEMGPVFLPIH